MNQFVHLHLHSEYSLLDGACRISEIAACAKKAGHSAVAITDHGVLYGAVAFYDACKAEGIKPIIGCEVYVAPRGRFSKEGKIDQSGHHLLLLVKNEQGYRNLCRMVSKSFTEGFYSKPRVDLELLETYNEGLIALSGCIGGTIPRCILAGDMASAEQYAMKMKSIFGVENFYLEIQDHGMEEERAVREGIYQLSEQIGIPMVATGDVHYLRKEDAQTQAILMCVQTGTTIADGRPMGFATDEFYYKSTEEMEELFRAYPDACANTVKIAERCNFDFTFGKFSLPTFPVAGTTPEELLRKYAFDGFENLLQSGLITLASHDREAYTERLRYELEVIHRMGFDEYYLIVRDFVHHAKSVGIPVGPGRGSGAGSLVAYCVGITTVDPIVYELLFERFLNPERISMPDFDIDFCYDRRSEIIEYVKQKYGADHVAQIVTFGTMAARAAVRDVGRALGMSYSDTDAVARLIPHEIGISIKDALQRKELRQMYDSSEQVQRLIDVSMALEGMPRHASTHAAGVVITEKPTSEYVPLSGYGDGIVTEYDMDTVARLGLVKFDFLGLRYLTILHEAETSIQEELPNFSLEKLPLDDPAVYRMLSAGETLGVFQLESGGMRQMLMQLQPSSIQEIIAAIALYRPGPMDSIPTFIARKFAREEVSYRVPALKNILGVTYGCIVYQEQVMQIFQTLAGYSLARADLVRRAMSKKKTEVLAREEEDFVKGCAQNGIDGKTARSIFKEMESFAKYAFNKSHAAAYGFLSYRTAYLMCHHPAAYFAALMTSVLDNTAKLGEYITYAQKKGIAVLSPDINHSRITFTFSGRSIRFGLLALKNVGRPFIEAIINERNRGGAFYSFEEFLKRMQGHDLNRRQVEALIKSGAFDALGVYRSRLLATYEEQLNYVSARNRSNITGQIDMFSTGDTDVAIEDTPFDYPDIPEFELRELLLLEKESSGMYFSGHLLDEYQSAVKAATDVTITDLVREIEEKGEESRYKDGVAINIAGILSQKSVKTTRNGGQMAFVTLEDRYAEIEVVVFPKVFEANSDILTQETPLLVQGTLSVQEDEGVKILARRLTVLKKDSPSPKWKRLVLRVQSLQDEKGKNVMKVLSRKKGNLPVVILDINLGKYVSPKGLTVDPASDLLEELMLLLGRENIVLQ